MAGMQTDSYRERGLTARLVITATLTLRARSGLQMLHTFPFLSELLSVTSWT